MGDDRLANLHDRQVLEPLDPILLFLGMLEPVRIKAMLLIAAGQKEKALRLIQKEYGATAENAQQLLDALEAESPLPKINPPGKKDLFRYAGIALTVISMVILAVGAVGYFTYSVPEQEWIRAACTVSKIEQGGAAITFSYLYRGSPLTITDVNSYWREFDLHEGQALEILVNPEQPEQVLLPIAKPHLQAWATRILMTGAILMTLTIVLWRARRMLGD